MHADLQCFVYDEFQLWLEKTVILLLALVCQLKHIQLFQLTSTIYNGDNIGFNNCMAATEICNEYYEFFLFRGYVDVSHYITLIFLQLYSHYV